MPGGVARVYPASGAVAMLPLTPANNYNPTVLFCGGSDMPDEAWGNYSWPFIDTWEYPASKDCQRLTPEPEDGSQPSFEQDDDMLDGRTMGQFIILPDGKLLVVNGGQNGTAGYSTQTLTTQSYSDMPFGMSLASGPTTTPAIYDPNAPKGSRWSDAGLSSSTFARLYHSSAILLPDASVLIAGSNPNVDVNITTAFPTTYQAEIFYPPYFSASVRPEPTGVPTTLSYGGDSFDITVPASSYSGSANDAADNTTVVVIRPGFTTHAMNMGQRYLQLNNTYTVQTDGTIILHVAQMPPLPTVFQPGPAFLYVTINGVPSQGTYLIVGNGQVGDQPVGQASSLPDSVRLDNASGSADGSNTGSGGGGNGGGGDGSASGSSHTAVLVGGIVGGLVVIGAAGALIGICLARRRRAANNTTIPGTSYAMRTSPSMAGARSSNVGGGKVMQMRDSDTSAFTPLQHENDSQAWNGSTASLSQHIPYRDHDDRVYQSPLGNGEQQPRDSGLGVSEHYDPYAAGNARRY